MSGYLAFGRLASSGAYRLLESADGETWGEFSPQPAHEAALNVRGLWANPYGREIHMATYDSSAPAKIGVWDGSSWVTHDLGTGPGPGGTYAIAGRAADDVLAGCAAGEIWHWDGVSYTFEYNSGSYVPKRMQHFSDGQAIAICTASPYRVLWRSALGSWSDIWADITATGMTIPVDVWGSSSSDIYILGRSGTNIRIAHFDGVSWSQVYYDASSCSAQDGSIGGSNSANVWIGETTITVPGYERARQYDGASWDTQGGAAELTYVSANCADSCCVIGTGDKEAVICSSFPARGAAWFHNGDHTWTRSTVVGATYEFYTLVAYDIDSTAPYLTSQTPEPGDAASTARGPFAFTVTDALSQVQQSSVVIDFDGAEIYDGSAWAYGWTSSTIAAVGVGFAVVLNPTVDVDGALHTIRVQAQDAASNALDQTYAVLVPQDSSELDGTAWAMNDAGTHELAASGKLKREATAATRCRIRLMTRKGEWFADAELGSLLHTIQTTKGADRKIAQYATEALQPLIDDGTITSVEVGRIELDHADGKMVAEISITVPGTGRVALGAVPIGSNS